MFTGLIQATGTVRRITGGRESRRLVITSTILAARIPVGASVSVSGACLTVVHVRDDEMEMDVGFETLQKTTLGNLRVGERVNLEPSLRVGDPLDGHLVTGHVDGVGRLRRRTPRGDAVEMWIDAAPPILALVAVKGSIAVDGVSLTVNLVDGRGFAVGLIPHTLAVTTLSDLRTGAPVNLEVDVVARYVARILQRGSTSAIDSPTSVLGHSGEEPA